MDKYKLLINKISVGLKSNGFTKKDTTLYFNKVNNWGLINFQKSRSSEPDQILFTINLGVCSEKIRSFHHPLTLLKPVLEDCHWRMRIGDIMEEKQDYWWKITEYTNLDDVANKIIDVLTNKGIPEILKHISDEDLEKGWIEGSSGGLTKFERLLYLTTILKLYSRSTLNEVAKELMIYSADAPVEDVAHNHLKKLGVKL